MKIIIADTQSAVLDRWRSELAELGGICFRQGYGSETVGDCDAAVMSVAMAHDRYGGMPKIGRSQILVNRSNDGYAPLIVTTPPLASSGEQMSDDLLGRRVMQSLSACLKAIKEFNAKNEHQQIRSLFLHIGGLGFDQFPVGVAESAAKQAFTDLLHSG